MDHPPEPNASSPGLQAQPGPLPLSPPGAAPVRTGLEAGRLRAGRLAGLTMPRAIFVLSWPVLVDSLLNSLVGLTDTVLAAGISEAATDAIGGASYIVWFLSLTIVALDVGATALVSRAVGGRRLGVANAAVGQVMILAVVVGVLMGLATAAMVGPLAAVLGLSPDASDAFATYLLILAVDVPFMAVMFGGIACLRGAGDSVRPLAAMVIVNIVNVVVSWALAGVDLTRTRILDGGSVTRTVLHNPFGFDLGVPGIAIGTLAAHAVGAALILVILLRGSSGLRLRRRRLRPHWHTMRRLVRVGLPNYFETLGLWFGNFLVLLIVSRLERPGGGGEGLLGAHIVAIRIEAFSFLPGFAMGMAAATLAGQYLGAGSAAHARRAVLACTAIAAAMMGVFGLAFILLPRTIVGLFTSQPTHLDQAPALIVIAGIVQLPFAIAIVLRSAMRGAGDVRVVMHLTWLTTFAVRLPLAYLFSGVDIPLPGWLGGGVIVNPSPFRWGLAGLWVGLSLEIIVRAMTFAARFMHGGWARQRV